LRFHNTFSDTFRDVVCIEIVMFLRFVLGLLCCVLCSLIHTNLYSLFTLSERSIYIQTNRYKETVKVMNTDEWCHSTLFLGSESSVWIYMLCETYICMRTQKYSICLKNNDDKRDLNEVFYFIKLFRFIRPRMIKARVGFHVAKVRVSLWVPMFVF
jgi:hypothetical protein